MCALVFRQKFARFRSKTIKWGNRVPGARCRVGDTMRHSQPFDCTSRTSMRCFLSTCCLYEWMERAEKGRKQRKQRERTTCCCCGGSYVAPRSFSTTSFVLVVRRRHCLSCACSAHSDLSYHSSERWRVRKRDNCVVNAYSVVNAVAADHEPEFS